MIVDPDPDLTYTKRKIFEFECILLRYRNQTILNSLNIRSLDYYLYLAIHRYIYTYRFNS